MTPKEFVQRILNHYGAPEHVADRKAFSDDYIASLNGTDADVLAEASDRLIKAHTYRVWPTIGECIQMVDLVARERARQRQQAERQPIERRQEPTPEQKARVAALVKGATEKLRSAVEERAKKANAQLDWKRTTQPEWDERMATSDIARQLAMPREVRKRGAS